MKKVIFVLLLVALLCSACGDESYDPVTVEGERGLFDKLFEDSLNHWTNEDDGGNCYSTLQRGCVNSLLNGDFNE